MRINIATAAGAVVFLGLPEAGAAAACNKNNACYSIVSANANAPSSIQKPGCASFFRTTVTPKPVTKTDSQVIVTTKCPTITSTVKPSTTRTRTATQSTTSTATVTSTIVTTKTVAATFQTDTTTTITSTDISTETSTTTVYSTTTLKQAVKRAPTKCPTTSAGPSTLPTYATVCQDTSAYSSACSCYGATHATTTTKPCSTTITKRVTSTRTLRPSTVTHTQPAPVTTTTTTTTIATTKVIKETDTSTFTTDTVTVYTSTSTVKSTVSSTTTAIETSTQTVTVSPSSYNCSKYGYIVALETLYEIDLGTGDISLITNNINNQGNAVNAMGYNIFDNYLYAVEQDGSIITIDNDGNPTTIGDLGSYANVGAVDINGIFWVAYQTNWWKIDAVPSSPTYAQILDSGTFDTLGFSLTDWVYLPTHPGYLYSIAGPNTSLLRFSMTTHQVELLTAFSTAPQEQWPFNFAAEGVIYAITGSGNTGEIWQFDVETGVPTFFVQGPSNTGIGDSARCVLNPNV